LDSVLVAVAVGGTLTLRQKLDGAADGKGQEPHNQIHEILLRFHEQDVLTGSAVHERDQNLLVRILNQLRPHLRHPHIQTPSSLLTQQPYNPTHIQLLLLSHEHHNEQPYENNLTYHLLKEKKSKTKRLASAVALEEISMTKWKPNQGNKQKRPRVTTMADKLHQTCSCTSRSPNSTRIFPILDDALEGTEMGTQQLKYHITSYHTSAIVSSRHRQQP
jgi:hypothetical protein